MSVHDVSTCLKQYLRALPVSSYLFFLLPPPDYPPFQQEPLLLFSFAKFALALDKLPATERIDAWQLYYLWLPSAHRNLTEALFRYLNRVARRQNRMDTTNLALVFTPAMLRNEAIADLQLHSFVVNALKVLIGHTDEIFRCTLWLAVRDNEALSSGTNLKRSGSQQQNIPLAADDAEAEAAFRASGLHKFISSSSASMKRAKKNLADIIKRGLSSTGPGPGAGTADSAGPDGSGTSALAAVAAVAVSAAQPGAAPPSTLDESNNNELPEANTTLVPTGKHKPVKQRSKSHLWKDVPKSIAFATIRGKGGNVSAAAMAYNDQDPDGTTSTNGDNDAFKGNATISASSSRSAKKRPSMFTVSSSVDNLATSASSSTANSGTSNASSNSEDALHNPTGDSNKPVTSPTAGSRSSAELSAASSLRRHNTISTAARPKIQIDTGSDIIVVSPAAGVDDEGEDQTTPTNAQVPLSATSQHSSSSGGIKRAATLRRGRPASDFVDPPQRPPSITTANAPMSSRPARNDSSDEEDDFDLPPPSAQIRHARWNSDIGDVNIIQIKKKKSVIFIFLSFFAATKPDQESVDADGIRLAGRGRGRHEPRDQLIRITLPFFFFQHDTLNTDTFFLSLKFLTSLYLILGSKKRNCRKQKKNLKKKREGNKLGGLSFFYSIFAKKECGFT